jgi:hypothetical protein
MKTHDQEIMNIFVPWVSNARDLFPPKQLILTRPRGVLNLIV